MSWRLQTTGQDTVYSVYLLDLNEFTVYDGAGEEAGCGYVEPKVKVHWISCDVPKQDIAGITKLVFDACVD